MAENRRDREATLEAAIRRTVPGVEGIVFDEDDEHVYIGPIQNAVERYRLGTEAKQVLLGEFPLEELEGVTVLLHPPEGDD